MYSKDMLEEELKGKVGADWFADYDTTQILTRVDFCVADSTPLFRDEVSYLWAEAKRGNKHAIEHSFAQLILTIGKERTFDKKDPPKYLGAFDCERIGFLPYSEVLDIFYMNDFNWQVTPSDHTTREFALLLERITEILGREVLVFRYREDEAELRRFIKQNFKLGSTNTSKIRITQNNFVSVYSKWMERVKDSIQINWDKAKEQNILPGDFYLADLLSSEGYTLRERLNVVLRRDNYQLNKRINDLGLTNYDTVEFCDEQRAYNEFWTKYERPPKKKYVDWMIERRDLLQPQDVRERKGSYFTPRIWVEKSQEYLALELGENWQDEYYVWDCAAGTGNLLVGLTNKHRIFASTLDVADVKVMHERITKGANLLESHVFQFDFLNDGYTQGADGSIQSDLVNCKKLPQDLRAIIADPEKRRKLVIYINPPYAEATSGDTSAGTGSNKAGVAINNKVHEKYKDIIGRAGNELFALFLIRIYHELPLCKIGEFSTLKTLQGPNFQKFRQNFRAKLGRIFLMPSKTFDNVKGDFPIGLKIWDTAQNEIFSETQADVYDNNGEFIGYKNLYSNDDKLKAGAWLSEHRIANGFAIGMIESRNNDFQDNNRTHIEHEIRDSHAITITITITNIQISAIFLAIRQVFVQTWLNDRDQFLYPNDGWQTDLEFQSDCLAFTLFHSQNRITRTEGVNHWIPFTEAEVDAPALFESNFMTDYIKGRLKADLTAGDTAGQAIPPSATQGEIDFGEQEAQAPKPFRPQAGGTSGVAMQFSAEAKAVFTAGRTLWRYYMTHQGQEGFEVNASLYDIRAFFQGFEEKGGKRKMRSRSDDEHYTELITTLRHALKALALKIQSKVYEHGFLRQ